MFIGHYAPAFVAAAFSPKAPRLGTLFVGAQLVDLAFFTLVMADVEKLRLDPSNGALAPFDLYHMPYTHSIVGSVLWAAGFALILRALGSGWRAALIGGAVVLSHWFLDLLVHLPDLTLAGHPPKLGFGLWRYPTIEIPLELALTFGALAYWAQARGAWIQQKGKVVTLATVLLIVQLINWFGPAPTDMRFAMPLMALATYGFLIALAAWADRGRARNCQTP